MLGRSSGNLATMIGFGCLPTQALAFLAVFVYATHATQAIAFEWKLGLMLVFILLHDAMKILLFSCLRFVFVF